MTDHDGPGGPSLEDARIAEWLGKNPQQIPLLLRAVANPDTFIRLHQEYTRMEKIKCFWGIRFTPSKPRSSVRWVSQFGWFEFKVVPKQSVAA